MPSRIPPATPLTSPLTNSQAQPRPESQYGQVVIDGRPVRTVNGRPAQYADTGEPYQPDDVWQRLFGQPYSPLLMFGAGLGAHGLAGAAAGGGDAGAGAGAGAGSRAADTASSTTPLWANIVRAAAPLIPMLMARNSMNSANAAGGLNDPMLRGLIGPLQQLFQTQIQQSQMNARRQEMTQPLFEQVLRQVTGQLPTWTRG